MLKSKLQIVSEDKVMEKPYEVNGLIQTTKEMMIELMQLPR